MATVFNPYKDAAKDPAMVKTVNRDKWKAFCCRCNKEKFIKGGTFPHKAGEKIKLQQNGLLRRFICAECLPSHPHDKYGNI